MRGIHVLTAFFVLPFALMIYGCSGEGPTDPNNSFEIREIPSGIRPYADEVVEAANRFALDLYAELKQEEGNLFFSPYSISSALSMTYAGAEGVTEQEMAGVLHIPGDEQQWHAGCGALQNSLDRGATLEGYELSIANRLWGQQGYGFLESFLNITQEYYGAGFEALDFSAFPEKSRQIINDWVADQTRDRIQDLLPSDAIRPGTLLVLTNAIYFKGTWLKQFDPSVTAQEPFLAGPSDTVYVPMMHLADEFEFSDLEDLKILSLPYTSEDLSMIILLPARVDGLAELEAELTVGDLATWIGSMNKENVAVALPRFELTSKFRLAGVLSDMGMPSAFGMADFSGITGYPELFISEVYHKAFVGVDEEGTEAAAATGVVMGIGGPSYHSFVMDHPFVFLIRDNVTGSILFIGRIQNPLL